MHKLKHVLLPLIPRLRDILQLRFTDIFAALSPAALTDISPANPFKRLARVLGYAGLRLVGNVFQPIENRDELRGKEIGRAHV